MLPLLFQRQMQALLGPEYTAFADALREVTPVSIRWNPAKAAHSTPTPGVPVPWHPNAFYLGERPVFTLDPLFHAGAYYVQEASSMFLYEALRQTVDFSRPLKILDLCAAPGGKSTLLAAMMNAESLLVSNEVIPGRVNVLRENLERWGAPNVAVTSAAAEAFAALEGWFDVVVVDAPCSGEGLFRKDPDATNEWSPTQTEVCALRQRDILAHAVATLAPGGTLVYSTCTYNRLENEGNVAWMTDKLGLEILPLTTPPAAWGIVAGDGGYRFFPHRLRGEGFFLSVLRKKSGDAVRHTAPPAFRSLKPLPKTALPEMARWLADPAAFRFFQLPGDEVLALPAALLDNFLILDKTLRNKWFGLHLGQFKGKDFAPAHPLALSTALSPALPRLALSREQALLFLKKETFPLPPGTSPGWVLAAFEGLPLGWIKVLPNRMNNYLPPERRIRMTVR